MTKSDHPYKKYSNLIKNKEVTTPESVWVTDITYIHFKQGFTYLSLITDYNGLVLRTEKGTS